MDFNKSLVSWVIVASLSSAQVIAGTVFVSPVAVSDATASGEIYPESRFGQEPQKIETGVRRGYASRAVEEMELSDEAVSAVAFNAGSRSPAGLEVTGSAPSAPPAPPSKAVAPKEVTEWTPPKDDPSLRVGAIARKGVQEVALIAGDLGFFPKTVFVTRDVPVRMFVTGASKNTLCIMMDSFQVRKQVRSQKIEEITFTPNTPGKYRFYCPVNGMEGIMVVKEFASNTGE